MVRAPAEKQKTAANIATLNPSFVIASLFPIHLKFNGASMLRALVRRGGRTTCKIVWRTVRENWPAFEVQVFRLSPNASQAASFLDVGRNEHHTHHAWVFGGAGS